MKEHYDSKYFAWQKNIGAFGGKANLFKFENSIKENDKVIEFGCGGGFLLKNINCKEKIGIEINESSILSAQSIGINTVNKIDNIEDDWADVIISNHALEHVENPHNILGELYHKLKKDGIIIFVVPHERKMKYKKDDLNMHLYTWSPMNLGNLFQSVGFRVDSISTVYHKWAPYRKFIIRYLGWKIFNMLSYVYGHINTRVVQVKIIARK